MSFSAEMVFKSRHMVVNKKSTKRHQQRINTASENKKMISLPEKGKKHGAMPMIFIW